MKKFGQREIEMIKESFELRKNNCENNSKHIEKLNSISAKLTFPITYLNSMQRSIIRGCIKEFIIYPNQNLLWKSDYEIMLSRKEIEQDCLKIDIALSILNKIKKREESKERLFKEAFDKIDQLANSKKVYYSISDSGEIYKVGIVTDKDKGLKSELELTSTLSNFKIGNLSKDSFMKSAKPNELVDYLKRFGKENKLSENQNRIINILEKASV